MIVSGRCGPGDRLVIDRLALELVLSAVPVREGIRRLQAEGCAEFQKNTGARVVGMDLTAFLESMEVLEVLEARATALTASHLKAIDVREADRSHRHMKKQLSGYEVRDPVGFSNANRKLHECLCRRCPNPRLLELVDAEWDRVQTSRRSTFFYTPARAAESVAEHAELLTAIMRGGAARVIESLARSHRQSARLAMADRLGEHPEPTVSLSPRSRIATGRKEDCA